MEFRAKRKALAELDGWKDIDEKVATGLSPHAQLRNADYKLNIPNYCFSYDDALPLIQKWMNGKLWKDLEVFYGWLGCDLDQFEVKNFTLILNSRPEELCDALLKAAGKWVD